jgi:hypothetical protein
MNVTACRAFIENVCLYHRMGRLKNMSRKDQKIYCNCCGKVICMLSEKDHTSFLTVEKEWGYFSDKKDGRIHRMDICESCYEKMVGKFVIPPEEEQVTEFV